jgi:hypothetical protein
MRERSVGSGGGVQLDFMARCNTRGARMPHPLREHNLLCCRGMLRWRNRTLLDASEGAC